MQKRELLRLMITSNTLQKNNANTSLGARFVMLDAVTAVYEFSLLVRMQNSVIIMQENILNKNYKKRGSSQELKISFP